MTDHTFTLAREIKAYNAGVQDVLDRAKEAADAITATGKRPIVEGFAIAVLDELHSAGRDLLIHVDGGAK